MISNSTKAEVQYFGGGWGVSLIRSMSKSQVNFSTTIAEYTVDFLFRAFYPAGSGRWWSIYGGIKMGL